jgi:hypothetical protein
MMIEIVVTPCKPAPYPKKWAGRFEARIDGRGAPAPLLRLLCTSRQPLLDAARVLIAEGCDPGTTVTMQHADSSTVAMTATLGTAARLTVDESGPSFKRWKAMPPRNGSRIIAPNEEGATQSHPPARRPDNAGDRAGADHRPRDRNHVVGEMLNAGHLEDQGPRPYPR